MKERLLKIILGVPQSDPIYQLEWEYKKLNTDEDRASISGSIKG
ncbi:hypothetical protein [uncultured Mucilaginibacter sp.]|nr:hypothetical protein [uncultured Mucilaginibacter sp.]